MILALLLACSPFKGIDDRWNAAWEACDPDAAQGEPDPYDLDATLSADCQDTLLDDFKVDRESLAAVAETETSPALDACFVTSAYALLTRDAGRYATTEPGDGVFQVYLDQMQEVYWQLGGDDNRQLAYNYATWFTAGVVVESFEDGALAATYEDGLHLAPEAADECGVELAHLLFHESGHANLEAHVACPDDFEFTDCPDCEELMTTACDADDQGTFALESSLLALWEGGATRTGRWRPAHTWSRRRGRRRIGRLRSIEQRLSHQVYLLANRRHVRPLPILEKSARLAEPGYVNTGHPRTF